MKTSGVSEIGVIALVVVLLSPTDAWAYIDPGTGSYLFQLVIAGGLAGVYTLRRQWHSVRMWIRRGNVEE